MEGTRDEDYARRLERLQTKRWKTVLDVQRPYRWNVSRLKLGRTVEVGAGIGRLLRALPAGSIGVDHNSTSVDMARAAGLHAVTTEEWDASEWAHSAGFDTMLLAHLVEHLPAETAEAVIRHYLPAIRPGGRVVIIVPQEVGYRSDPTHVRFVDVPELVDLAARLGLVAQKSWSFPLPRPFGKLFIYNETCMVLGIPEQRAA